MKLNDQIMEIFRCIDMEKYDEAQSNLLWRKFNKALIRAERLEKLAEAVKAINKKT